MKLASFLLVLHAVEKGAAYVVKNHETKESHKVVPETECVQKIGGLCIQQRTKKHKKTKVAESEVVSEYASTDTIEQSADSLQLDPMLAYVATGDKSYMNIAAMADPSLNTEGGNNPLLSILAAKHVGTDPALAYALTKDPIMPLATEIASDPVLAIHQAVNNPRPINTNNILLSHFIGPQSAAATYALTGSPILANAQISGNKLPTYLAMSGQDPSRSVGYLAASLGDPLLAHSLTGDRQAMYAAATGNPELTYTAQQMNNPAYAYAMTGDPILAMQKPRPDDGTAQPVNPMMAYLAAKQGDPTLAFALTGNAQAAYASTLPNPATAALAGMTNQPMATYLLTKDPVMTYETLARANPNSPGLAYGAALSGDPAMAMALTGNPAIAYAAQTSNPGMAAVAASNGQPGLAYLATKDPVMMAMSSDNQKLKQLAGAMSGDPKLAYAVTGGDIGSMIAAGHEKPLIATLAQETGNPALTYMLTKDPTLTILAGDNDLPAPVVANETGSPAPVNNMPEMPLFDGGNMMPAIAAMTGKPLLAYAMTNDPMAAYAATMDNPLHGMMASQMNNPAATYMLTKDPLLTMMSGDQTGENNMMPAVAAMTGKPLLAYAMTNDPMAAYAATMDNPLQGMMASQMNNPAATYMLTKDPLLTMMSGDQSGENNMMPAVAAMTGKPLLAYAMTNDPTAAYAATMDNPMMGMMASQMNNPAATYVLTKDPVLAMMNSDPATIQNNPGLGYLAASTGNQMMTYALTGNPALAYASQHADPLLAVTATHANNPAATYMLTKDPVLTMMSAMQGGSAPAEPKPHNTMATYVAGKLENVTPGMAYGVTGDSNMLLTGQWGNSNMALATAMANGPSPASNNPTMDMLVASTMTDPNLSYALTGNALLANAVANGNGKDIMALQFGQQMNNPLMTYMLTKDPKLAYASTHANPLFSYTALQTNPALAAIATNDPMMLLLKNP